MDKLNGLILDVQDGYKAILKYGLVLDKAVCRQGFYYKTRVVWNNWIHFQHLAFHVTGTES